MAILCFISMAGGWLLTYFSISFSGNVTMLKMKMKPSILIVCFLLAMHANIGVEAGYGKIIKQVQDAFNKCCKKIKCKTTQICVPQMNQQCRCHTYRQLFTDD